MKMHQIRLNKNKFRGDTPVLTPLFRGRAKRGDEDGCAKGRGPHRSGRKVGDGRDKGSKRSWGAG
jgi:hypothetical protein